MRVSRHLIAAACAGALCVGAASATSAKAPPPDAPAWTTPSLVGPNESLQITVVCPVSKSPPPTITAGSQLFGEALLRLQLGTEYGGQTYIGTTKIASDVRGRPGDPNYEPDRIQTWGIDGQCPNGSQFNAAVAVDTLRQSSHPRHAPEPAPTPSRAYRVGEVAPAVNGLPMCGLRGNAYVVIDQGRAVVIDGSGHYVQAILEPGQTEDRTYKVTFNRDGKSVTHTPDGSTKPVIEVCSS